MKNIIIILVLAATFYNCSSSKYSVVTKADGVDLRIDLKANSKKIPSNPYTTTTPHLLSYSITNLDKGKKFNTGMSGNAESPYLLFTFMLSNKTMIEQKAELMQIRDISPLMTTTEQPLMVDLPKKTTIKDLVSVEIHYRNYLSQTGSSVEELKKHVSLDNGCSINEIKIIDTSEQLGNAIYLLEVCGKQMKYRRVGSVFYKDGENPTKH